MGGNLAIGLRASFRAIGSWALTNTINGWVSTSGALEACVFVGAPRTVAPPMVSRAVYPRNLHVAPK